MSSSLLAVVGVVALALVAWLAVAKNRRRGGGGPRQALASAASSPRRAAVGRMIPRSGPPPAAKGARVKQHVCFGRAVAVVPLMTRSAPVLSSAAAAAAAAPATAPVGAGRRARRQRQKQAAYIATLPHIMLLADELVMSVCVMLDVPDLLSLSRTCRRMLHVVNDAELWRQCFWRHFPPRIPSARMSAAASAHDEHAAPLVPGRSWKQILLAESRVERNWRTEEYDLTSFANGHEGGVYALHFNRHRQRLASAGADGEISIWDFNGRSRPLRRLDGHTQAVRTLQFSRDCAALFSGSSDSSIRVWDSELGVPTALVPVAHSVQVSQLVVDETQEGVIFSAGHDGVARLWDFRVDSPLSAEFRVPYTSNAALFSVCWDSTTQRLYTGTAGGPIFSFDLRNSRTRLHELSGHTSWVHSIAAQGEWIFSCGMDHSVRRWELNCEGPGSVASVAVYESSMSARVVQFSNNRLITTSWDGVIAAHDLSTLAPYARLRYPNLLYCSQFDDRYVCVGAQDGTVAAFDMDPQRVE